MRLAGSGVRPLDPSRVGAVLVTDLRARLRRPSAALLMAGAALAAVLVIPVPGPGRGLVQIGTTRALHTSGTLALATAMLLSIAVTFFGFYVVSDALGRDARTRVATLVASTPVSNLVRRADGVHLRLVAAERPLPQARAVEADLEDAYLRLMQREGARVAA